MTCHSAVYVTCHSAVYVTCHSHAVYVTCHSAVHVTCRSAVYVTCHCCVRDLAPSPRQVEGHPNKDVLLESARRLRLEKDREQELANQKIEQEQAIARADQRLARLQGQLKDLRSASMGTTPEGERRRRGGGHVPRALWCVCDTDSFPVAVCMVQLAVSRCLY